MFNRSLPLIPILVADSLYCLVLLEGMLIIYKCYYGSLFFLMPLP